MVHGPDLVRDGLGVGALVVPGLREAHSIGVDAFVGDGPRGRRHEQRRIEPTARENAERDVGHQLAFHGAQQRVAQRAPSLARERGRAARGLSGAPIGANLRAVPLGDEQRGGR